MFIMVGWVMLACEALLSIAFGVIFWRLWLRSPMSKATAVRAILAYIVGCAACLAIAMFLPL